MKILKYDEIDPTGAMQVNLLALDFPFTAERAAQIRKTDPRPFPCLAVYAVENEIVLGQVGVFRLPMVSTNGREDVGGVWAVSTHPQYSNRGIASRLLDEAHERMRQAGLRFSTLGTNRWRTSHRLYRQHGYEDMYVWGTALASWETAHQPTRMSAQPLDEGGFDFVDDLFASIAQGHLGFAWRHTPFAPLRDKMDPDDVRILWCDGEPVGYALNHLSRSILSISNLVLQDGIDPAEAVAAVSAVLKASYVRVSCSRPVEMHSLISAGYQVAHPNWDAFMVKPLLPEVNAEDARRRFGIGTDQFMISWLDTT